MYDINLANRLFHFVNALAKELTDHQNVRAADAR